MAYFWLAFGASVVFVDALLSMQSLVGIMDPPNRLWFLGTACLGFALTAAAVLFPVHLGLIRRKATRADGLVRYSAGPPVVMLAWVAVAGFDVLTSIAGAIWYGQLGNPIGTPVDFDQVGFEPANALVSGLYVALVLFVAFVCFQFGVALDTLRSDIE